MATISFENRVAIVTGAGGGIGRTHALEIARRGGKVVVNDLGGDVGGRGGSGIMAERVVEEIRAAGGTAIANGDSVASSEGAGSLVAAALDAFGRIDVLINNAGIMRNAYLEDISDQDWDDVIATHLTGSFKVTRAVWPHMKAQRYGRIVFTASSAGLFGTPILANYAAAKAGVAGLMNVAAIEGEAHGILCNGIMPNAEGRMADRMMADLGADASSGSVELPPEIGNSMDPGFNAPLAIFLASEACTSTHALYSQCLGRVARVFVGVTTGWQGQRQTPASVEEIAEHWAEIGDTSRGFTTPSTPHHELALVLSQGNAA
ncbi:MAG: SDR family NAD(P)-dependent oxidoreductase [Novosphingobium sp.]